MQGLRDKDMVNFDSIRQLQHELFDHTQDKSNKTTKLKDRFNNVYKLDGAEK